MTAETPRATGAPVTPEAATMTKRRDGLGRRDFLKAAVAVAAAAAAAPVARLAAAGGEPSEPRSYYIYYTPSPDEEQHYRELALAYGLGDIIIEKPDGTKCVGNPFLPGKCMAYTRRYEEDRFPIKPPGATSDFFSRCIRCGLCYFACHLAGYDAIRLGGPGDGFHRLGTPILDNLRRNPCELCMECTRVCPTGALSEVLEEAKKRAKKRERESNTTSASSKLEKPIELLVTDEEILEKTRMGIALIDPDLCLAWNDGDCMSCAAACPFGSIVFTFHYTYRGAVHTRVRPEKCVGCGKCVAACPVGGAAIHVLPEDEYERRTKNYKNTGMSYEEYLNHILELEVNDPMRTNLKVQININYIMKYRGVQKEKIVRKMG